MKNFIKKLKRPFELTPEQLKYAEEELRTIFGLKDKKREFRNLGSRRTIRLVSIGFILLN